MENIIKHRKENTPKENEDKLLVDVILETANSESQKFDDCITFAVGGLHTTGNVLTWCFYFLAIHPEIQDKVYKEIKKELGNNDVDFQSINDLRYNSYTRQVLDETFRCAVIAPWAARFQDSDSELGGHKIPKGVNRFNPENVKSRPALAFQPFGFAGKRICPGYRFAYAEATVCLVPLLRKFKIIIVDRQDVKPVYGLFTHSEDEIYIAIEKLKWDIYIHKAPIKNEMIDTSGENMAAQIKGENPPHTTAFELAPAFRSRLAIFRFPQRLAQHRLESSTHPE
ncbi:hypothetical protein KUTeg_008292, partial [Tegillarca granosa]